MKDKLDVKYTLEDSNGNKYTILDTQRVDLQEELNKEIEKQAKEIKRLKEEYVILQNASDEVEEEKDREIERLQDLCNKYEKEHKTTYEIWKKDIYLYNSMVDRIDKAIEYIENKNKYLDRENYYQVFEYRDIYLIPLLDILKGDDKE